MRRASRVRPFSPCGRRCRRAATTDEGSPLTRAAAAAACSTSPARGEVGVEARAVRPRSEVGHHGAVQRADLDPKSLPSGLTRGGSGMPVLRPCLSVMSGWVHRSLPTSRGGLFDPGRGTLKGWADRSARSPGYRNRDRGTRPRLRQRCPVSTAVPPPETSVSDIGIKAGIVKCHVMAVLGLDPRIGPASHDARSQRATVDVTAPGGRGWPGRARP